jgi:hypothetical protein
MKALVLAVVTIILFGCYGYIAAVLLTQPLEKPPKK